MDVQERNGVKSYEINTDNILPEWLSYEGRQVYQKKSETVRRRIELLQGLDFPIVTNRIVTSPDGNFFFGMGTYKPLIKCFEVEEFGVKWERHLDCLGLDVVCLGYDWRKLAILTDDRRISFYAPYGLHDTIRVPKYGRKLLYNDWNCHLCVSSIVDVYRFDLEAGIFVQPWKVGANCFGDSMASSPTHRLTVVGCTDGSLRFFDGREEKANVLTSFINVSAFEAEEVTSLAFHPSGYSLVAGSSKGVVSLYDLRSSKPLYRVKHRHELPIHTARFHIPGLEGKNIILSSDSKLIKLSNEKDGSLMTNITSNCAINDVAIVGDSDDPQGHASGLMLAASEQPYIQAFFCPSFGKAPSWCSYLDSLTEELEEGRDNTFNSEEGVTFNTQATYQDYTFLTNDELEKLGITNLIGTPFLRGYMHGYFIDQSLYRRIRAVANPFEYEEYRKKKIKQKLEDKQMSRISNQKDDVTINKDLVSRLQEKVETKNDLAAKTLLKDTRFTKALFHNPDYEMDKDTEDFRLRYPGVRVPVGSKKKEDDYDSDLEQTQLDNRIVDSNKDVSSSDDDEDESEEEDGFAHVKVRGENYEQVKSLKKKNATTVNMYEATSAQSDEQALLIGLGNVSKAKEISKLRKQRSKLMLKERLKDSEDNDDTTRGFVKPLVSEYIDGGNKRVHYVPRDSRRNDEVDEEQEDGNGIRRKKVGKRRKAAF